MMQNRNGLLVKNKFLEYLLPTMFTSMAISLASVVDGIIVGNLLGSSALAAVGLSSPIIFGVNGLFFLFAVGGITSASIARGERDEKRANIIFTLCQSMGVTVLILYATLITIFSQPIALFLAHGDVALAELTSLFISSVVWAGPFTAFALCTAQFWKLDGSPRASTQISLIANVVNLISGYVLIRFFNAGIQGSGFSTVLGYMIGTLFTLGYYRSAKRNFRFILPDQQTLTHLRAIISKGAYRFLATFSNLVQNLVLNTLIVISFGSLGIASLTVCVNALMIANIVIGGASEALQPILGTLYGEKDIFGIRAVFSKAVTITLSLCSLIVIFFMLFPETIGLAFGLSSPESLTLLVPALRMFSLYLPLFALSQMFQTLYNSTEHSKRSILMSIMEGLVFINGYALLLTFANSKLIWLCYAFASATMVLIMILNAKLTLRQQQNLQGVLLLPPQEKFIQWQSSVPADLKQATKLSQSMLEFCQQQHLPKQLSNHMAVTIEEMLVNTVRFNQGNSKVKVDVLLGISKEEILLRFRDNGACFDPTNYQLKDTLIHESIDLTRKLASKITYSHQLGFNITVLIFLLPKEAGNSGSNILLSTATCNC